MKWIISLFKSLTCKHHWLRNEHLPHMARECGKCGKTEFDEQSSDNHTEEESDLFERATRHEYGISKEYFDKYVKNSSNADAFIAGYRVGKTGNPYGG